MIMTAKTKKILLLALVIAYVVSPADRYAAYASYRSLAILFYL